MSYKIGDEVYVKAEVIGIAMGGYKIKTKEGIFFIEKECIEPIPEMTAEEAWEVARKIAAKTGDGGYSSGELREIFGKSNISEIFKHNSPSEARAKIEKWEAKKKIKVGDLVTSKNYTGIVTCLWEGFACVMYSDGSCGQHDITNVKNTGRHIDIASLLGQIGKEN